VHALVLQLLRDAGHDVRAVNEERPGVDDEEVARLAGAEERLLLTEDRDFGHLVRSQPGSVKGVVYLRYGSRARRQLAEALVELIQREGEQLYGSFVVMQPGRTRISRLPDT
jgi:predicted nuclease of predicted toxin-antitoxin system